MQLLLVAGGALVLLSGLLYCTFRDYWRAAVPLKTGLSVLFVLVAVMQPHPLPLYYRFLLPGLLLCLGGDFFLALPRRSMFLVGLVFFLLGHIAYVIGFVSLSPPDLSLWLEALLVVFVSGSIYRWLLPFLGRMKIPVLLYVVVISSMLIGAWGVLADERFGVTGRGMVFAGAFLFYVSDLFVARNRFVEKRFINRLIGLPLYYAGQFLLAFSVGVLQGV